MNRSTTTHRNQSDASAMRVVGIGASAGGLVALEQFLAGIPVHSGMAYVVVQHLDPTQKALLPTLLQRVTPMPVREAEQAILIEPDSVYVIPPNAEISVLDGALQLAAPTEPRGMRLPVNVLFSSLARTQGQRAIGVVLSGMGSDGTLGLGAIKAVGGLAVVQEPSSAQFDSMPRSAIEADCADIIAAPDELPALIIDYVARTSSRASAVGTAPQSATASAPLQHIIELLQRRTRHDFALHKQSTLLRRIERRMAIYRIASLAQYADYLEQNAQEVDLLFKELLIGVTGFFRDAAVWDHLAKVVLPELLARRTTEHNLRAWSVGCSTGEEAYSLAMVFSEVVARLPQPHPFTLKIFASDLSPDAIATARRGQYPLSIDASVSAVRLERFFSVHDTGYQVSKGIRDMVLFAQHDVVLDPPFTKLDFIACRNLLIYLDPMLQRRLLPLFHYSLRPGGVLLLGGSETVGRLNHLFSTMQPKHRLFRRQDDIVLGGPDFLAQSFPPIARSAKEHVMSRLIDSAQPIDTLQTAADRFLLQGYAPAAVILNGEGDIVYISGSTGKSLEPAAGKANWNFYAMVRESMRAPLAAALQQAVAQSEPLQIHGLQVPAPGGVQVVDVTVQALSQAGPLCGMTIVVFRDAALATPRRGKRGGKGVLEVPSAADLQQYRDEIQSLRNETRVSREELQAATRNCSQPTRNCSRRTRN